MADFYTEDNLRMLVSISKKYFADKFNFVVDDEKALKKLTYEMMTRVAEECKGQSVPLEKRNVAVLSSVKNVYITRYQLVPTNKKPNIQSLNRDREIFGSRPINVNNLMPEADPYIKKPQEEKNVTRIMEDRDKEIGLERTRPQQLAPATKIVAEENETFLKQLKELEDQRKEIDKTFERQEVDKEMHEMLETRNHDPKSLFSTVSLAPVQEVFTPAKKEQTIAPKVNQTRLLEKYISVQSQDRQWWVTDFYRYQYSVGLTTRLRNINAISIGKVVIPDEIASPGKPSFNYDFGLSCPYLILRIDEFTDVYEGENQVVKTGFCKLLHHRAYRGENGRGYVVLKPEMKEKKYFYPAPLSALNRLSVSILKPSGQLVNRSVDSYKILSITYNGAKPNYLMVTTNVYFDKNEFYPGDSLIMKNYLMTKLSGSQADEDIAFMNNFVNRVEGHDIMESGTANGNGYYNSFYIECPGTFVASTGTFVPNSSVIGCINAYNAALGSPSVNGNILNLSLQNSIGIKLEMIVDDAKTIDMQSGFQL